MTEPQRIRRDPPGWDLPYSLLRAFELGLDPYNPERGTMAGRVLGYGEISTVFAIPGEAFGGWAFKRMAVFRSLDEVERYTARYDDYNRLLSEDVGLHLPDHGYAAVGSSSGRPILYLVQQKVSGEAIASRTLRAMPPPEARTLLQRILHELEKVWDFNSRQGTWQVAIDGQLSNWALIQGESDAGARAADPGLAYLDTSTPLFKVNGDEQLDPELFLRSAPSFLVWILRALFLTEVMERYYLPRQVLLDVVANLYKERLDDLMPTALAETEPVLARWESGESAKPFRLEEVQAYYRRDAMIWRVFQAMRRFDRFLHRHVLRKEYPYILPGKIQR